MAGRGRLGKSLAAALGAELVPGRGFEDRAGQLPPGALVFLAVPDPAIAPLARELAGRKWAEPRPGFAHLSGALDLEPLTPLRKLGSEVGSMHPLQSFPQVRGAEAFAGSLFAIEASTPAMAERLAAIARRLGGRPRPVEGAQARALYHATAVLASNYLVALAGEASSVMQEGLGWDRAEALEALLPLMSGVLESLRTTGLPHSLIGPIRRGDPATVRRHLVALEALQPQGVAPTAIPKSIPTPNLPAGTYRILGLAALELALEAGLEPPDANRIAEALTGDGSDQEVTER